MKAQNWYLFLVIFTLISCKVNRLTELKSSYSENTILVVNKDWVVIEPTIFLNRINNKDLLKVSLLPMDSEEGRIVIEVELTNTGNPVVSDLALIDRKFIEQINPEQETFYFVDGMPLGNYRSSYNYLINRRINEINRIGVEAAIAIWGKRHGENGAIQIKTEEREGERIIPVMINDK